jgi:hypothetical protein
MVDAFDRLESLNHAMTTSASFPAGALLLVSLLMWIHAILVLTVREFLAKQNSLKQL